MADDYATCPWSLFADERLAEASLAEISGVAIVMLACDDWGRFEGRVRVFARRFGTTVEEVEHLFGRLEAMRFARFYEAPTDAGPRRVGVVIGFHEMPGLPFRAAHPSQRGASLYPDDDGHYTESRRERASSVQAPRKERASSVQAPRKERASSVQAPRKERASSVQAECKPGASYSRARVDPARSARASAQHSTAQHDPRASHSDQGGPPPGAPPQPSPPGSTDARAIDSLADAAPSPALEAREAQHEASQEADPYVEPYVLAPAAPRPAKDLAREQEAERRAKARADYERLVAIDAAEKASQGAA